MREAVIMTLVVAGFSLPPVVVALWPTEGAAVAVITTGEASDVAAAVDARLLSLSDHRHSAVLRSATTGGDFVRRLRGAGATLVVVAPDDLGCLAAPGDTASPFSRK